MPNIYSHLEYEDMIFGYGFCIEKATTAAVECRRWFPQQRHPNNKVFTRVFGNF